MRSRGIPFSLWCPIHPPTTAAPTTTTKSPDMPYLPQFPPLYFPLPPWGLPPGPQNPPGQNQQIPQFPSFPKFPPQYPVPVTAIPATTSAPTTTTQSAAGSHPFNMPFSPFGLPFPWNFWMSHPAAKQMPAQPPVFNSPYYPFPPVFNYPYPHHPPKMDPTQGRPPVLQAPGFPNPFPPYGQIPVKPMYHG